nr:hypothetical protein [Niallia taxi]
MHLENYQSNEDGESFTFKTAATIHTNLQIGMVGKHKVQNASLASQGSIAAKGIAVFPCRPYS